VLFSSFNAQFQKAYSSLPAIRRQIDVVGLRRGRWLANTTWGDIMSGEVRPEIIPPDKLESKPRPMHCPQC
jgi:hypothetical protein